MPKVNENSRLNLIAKYFSKQKEEPKYYSLYTLFWYVDIDKKGNVDIRLLDCVIDGNEKFCYRLFTKDFAYKTGTIAVSYISEGNSNIHLYDCVTGAEVDVHGKTRNLHKFSEIIYGMWMKDSYFIMPTYDIDSPSGKLELHPQGIYKTTPNSKDRIQISLDRYRVAEVSSFRPFYAFCPNLYVSRNIKVQRNGSILLKCRFPSDTQDIFEQTIRSVCLDSIMAQNIVAETKIDLEQQMQMLARRDKILNFSK